MLRYKLNNCLDQLPTATNPTRCRILLANVLIFCEDLELHHDIEEKSCSHLFQVKTDISHWSRSHEALHSTLESLRRLARAGLQHVGSEGTGMGHGWISVEEERTGEEGGASSGEAAATVTEIVAATGIRSTGLNQDQRDAIVAELRKLEEITLPHLVDEEVMSQPEELAKLWPTEQDFQIAFPWTR